MISKSGFQASQLLSASNSRKRRPFLHLTSQTMAPPGYFTILYFASAQTCTRKQSETIEAPCTVAALLELLAGRYAGFEPILQSSALTINLDYVSDDTSSVTNNAGDEVAIIPPVSSG